MVRSSRQELRWDWQAASQGWNCRLDGTWETALKGLCGGLFQVVEILEAFLEVSPVFETACLTYVLEVLPLGLEKSQRLLTGGWGHITPTPGRLASTLFPFCHRF